MAGNCTQAPQARFARDQPPPPAAETSKESRGTAPRALSQERRPTTHNQRQQTPARSRGELHPRPSATIGKGPPTTTTSGSQLGMVGNWTQGLQPGLAEAHPQHTHATRTETQRRRAPQERPRTPHHNARTQTPHTTNTQETQPPTPHRQIHPPPPRTARSGRKPHPGPSVRIGEGLTTGLAPTPAVSPSRERRGQAPQDPPPIHNTHTCTPTSARGGHTHTTPTPTPTQAPQTHKTHESTSARHSERHTHPPSVQTNTTQEAPNPTPQKPAPNPRPQMARNQTPTPTTDPT